MNKGYYHIQQPYENYQFNLLLIIKDFINLTFKTNKYHIFNLTF